VNFTKNKENKL